MSNDGTLKQINTLLQSADSKTTNYALALLKKGIEESHKAEQNRKAKEDVKKILAGPLFEDHTPHAVLVSRLIAKNKKERQAENLGFSELFKGGASSPDLSKFEARFEKLEEKNEGLAKTVETLEKQNAELNEKLEEKNEAATPKI